MFKKLLSITVILSFVLSTLGPIPQAHADSIVGLPTAGAMIDLSPAYDPVIIRGLTVHKDNPFLFDFIVDVGQDRMSGQPLKKEGEKLIKYFLASLAIPDKDAWVNLSPYEKDRIIPEALGQTDMGRDLLKQITASLIYPEKQLGKTFWDKVYAKSQEMYGSTQIPVNTFNKVWIMADRAEVFEHNQTAFVVGRHLKVMLEEDYLALQKNNNSGNSSIGVIASEAKQSGNSNQTHSVASQIVRQIILPELEKEVNTGKNFANLRQIFNSVILASWYKKNLKETLLNQVYANKSKVKGVAASHAKQTQEEIYEQYLKAYKKGVFNYIKEDIGTMVPRKYFSGGTIAAVRGPGVITDLQRGNAAMINAGFGRRSRDTVDFATLISPNSNPTNQAASGSKITLSRWVDKAGDNKPVIRKFSDMAMTHTITIGNATYPISAVNKAFIELQRALFHMYIEIMQVRDAKRVMAIIPINEGDDHFEIIKSIVYAEILHGQEFFSVDDGNASRREEGYSVSFYGTLGIGVTSPDIYVGPNRKEVKESEKIKIGRATYPILRWVNDIVRRLTEIDYQSNLDFPDFSKYTTFKEEVEPPSNEMGNNTVQIASPAMAAEVKTGGVGLVEFERALKRSIMSLTGPVNLGAYYYDYHHEGRYLLTINGRSRPGAAHAIVRALKTIVGENSEMYFRFRITDKFLSISATESTREPIALALDKTVKTGAFNDHKNDVVVRYVKRVSVRNDKDTLKFYTGNHREIGGFFPFSSTAKVYVFGPLLIIMDKLPRFMYLTDNETKWASIDGKIADTINLSYGVMEGDPYGVTMKMAANECVIHRAGSRIKPAHINLLRLLHDKFPNFLTDKVIWGSMVDSDVSSTPSLVMTTDLPIRTAHGIAPAGISSAAMMADKAVVTDVARSRNISPGGIDLNTTNGMQWTDTKVGDGVEMYVNQAMIARFRQEGIDNLSETVLKMTPVENIWSLAGLQTPKQA